MQHTTKACRWQIIACSERGASHIRHNLPNQDAIRSYLTPNGQPPVVLAVADGHGSAKSFRSDVGASLAVDIAVELLREFLQNFSGESPSVIKNASEQQLPIRILVEWRKRVDRDFQDRPFTSAELERLAMEEGTAAGEWIREGENYLRAYGATLITVAVAPEFALYLQLGDGEILVVSGATGEVSQPFPSDPELIANETWSLCLDVARASSHFRVRFQLFNDEAPGLILLATDGYPNSFRSREGFMKVGPDLLEMLRTEGADVVTRDLPEWLREASSTGSGDDVTVGLIFPSDAASEEEPIDALLPVDSAIREPGRPGFMASLGRFFHRGGKVSGRKTNE